MSRNPRNYTLNIAFKCISQVIARMRAMMVIPRGWCTFALFLAFFFLHKTMRGREKKNYDWLPLSLPDHLLVPKCASTGWLESWSRVHCYA